MNTGIYIMGFNKYNRLFIYVVYIFNYQFDVKDCLDQVFLWAHLWRDALVWLICGGSFTLNVDSKIACACSPELWESAEVRLCRNIHARICFCLVLMVEVMRPAILSSCHLQFPAMLDCTLELWAKINSSFRKLLYAGVFHDSNRNTTRIL